MVSGLNIQYLSSWGALLNNTPNLNIAAENLTHFSVQRGLENTQWEAGIQISTQVTFAYNKREQKKENDFLHLHFVDFRKDRILCHSIIPAKKIV